ncbi:hypothetical protein C8046_13635 [Serinibacter arcticus]|uniref:N-acetyltransferase domain-containing protein n=1 Tax=Serinibacter arcticus TaxID=1655435 RepID=A0A2U1ZX76_9MICO|nr:hypothetical protein [Serinibacter arcticus]PWD51543.1 hypothetical protein C8046_13635 [Serinibacter arcticus]
MTTTIPTRITSVRTLGPSEIDEWWPVYEAAFTPMKTRAAARHLLERQEFAEEMADPRILKLLASDLDGNAVAMTTVATDLDAVAWISPAFYRERYREALERDALWYVGYTLAHPAARRTSAFVDMLDTLIDLLRENRVTVGYDVSHFNDTSRRFAAHLFERARRVTDLTAQEIDVQTYYAATFT